MKTISRTQIRIQFCPTLTKNNCPYFGEFVLWTVGTFHIFILNDEENLVKNQEILSGRVGTSGWVGTEWLKGKICTAFVLVSIIYRLFWFVIRTSSSSRIITWSYLACIWILLRFKFLVCILSEILYCRGILYTVQRNRLNWRSCFSNYLQMQFIEKVEFTVTTTGALRHTCSC